MPGVSSRIARTLRPLGEPTSSRVSADQTQVGRAGLGGRNGHVQPQHVRLPFIARDDEGFIEYAAIDARKVYDLVFPP